jgi:superfamily II DNA or RNA helicase
MSQNTVFIQKSELLNGVLRYSSLSPLDKNYIDPYGTLRNRDRLVEFHNKLESEGYIFKFQDDETEGLYNEIYNSIINKFDVSSPFLLSNKLFPFQNIGLNMVWNQLKNDDSYRILIQWDTGAGKTLLSCLTSQKLFQEDLVDIVLVFCKKIKQYDWEQEFKRMTTCSVAKIGDLERSKRHKFYKEDNSQVLVLNYEKVRGPSMVKKAGVRGKVADYSRTDLQQILEKIEGKRTLIIIDEAQKINTGTSLLSDGFETLLNKNPRTKCLALTATPYTTSPLNIRNIFTTISPGIPGVSDLSRDEFKRVYAKELEIFERGYVRELYVREWDRAKLPLLGKKHENWTHIAMKSDPYIASQFPESMPKKIVYQLSEQDRQVYDWAEQEARERYNPDNPVSSWAYIDTLRMICNTTAGLRNSESKFAKEIVEQFDDLISIENSSKFQLIESNLETIFEANEKVVLFTFWTNGTLFPYFEALKNKFEGIPVLPIWGVGMKAEETTRNIQTFNSTKGPAVLLTSDVGQEGLNLYAPYLWNIEVPRTYAEYKQRSNRINRADSKSKGISHTWIYRPVASDTIEERIDAKVLKRRAEAGAIRGVIDENVDMEDTIDVGPKGLLFGS